MGEGSAGKSLRAPLCATEMTAGTPETQRGLPFTTQTGEREGTIWAFLRPGLVDEGGTTMHPL